MQAVPTLNELAKKRSEAAGDCRLWSPRDALLATVRQIDEGGINPDKLVISYREPTENEHEVKYGYFAAGVTTLEHAGLLMMTLKRVTEL